MIQLQQRDMEDQVDLERSRQLEAVSHWTNVCLYLKRAIKVFP